MKYFHMIVIIILSSFLSTSFYQVDAQPTNQNYVVTYKALVPLTDDLSNKNDKDKVAEVFEYYDGLGRAIQTIMRQASPLGHDVISFFEYDDYGRKSKSYLPYASSVSTDGNAKVSPVTEQAAFYTGVVGGADGSKAFAVQKVEASDVNRILKQGAPGEDWQPRSDPYSMTDHSIKKRAGTNAASEVLLFSYNAATGFVTAKPSLYFDYYSPNQLTKSVTYDENNNEVIEYTDKAGHMICKKVKAYVNSGAPVYAATYYVYDELGRLVVVVPPEAVRAVLSN